MFLWLTCQIWKPLLCLTTSPVNIALPFLTKPESSVKISVCCLCPPEIWKESFLTPLFPLSPSTTHLPYSDEHEVSSSHILLGSPSSCQPTSFFLPVPHASLRLRAPLPGVSVHPLPWLTPVHLSSSSMTITSSEGLSLPTAHCTSWGTLDFFHGSYHNFILIFIYVSFCLKCIAL